MPRFRDYMDEATWADQHDDSRRDKYDDERQRMRELREQGLTLRQIAQRFSVSHETVRRRLNE